MKKLNFFLTNNLCEGSVKEIVVISGKGGAGKTTIAASLISLAKSCVAVDCDVDASNLHLLLHPYKTVERNVFKSGFEAVINKDKCTKCGICIDVCRFDSISPDYDVTLCEGCGACAYLCPEKAIKMVLQESGDWEVSLTKYGKFVHGSLRIGAENSGKLVTLLRNIGKREARKDNASYIIVDAPPGVGCAVMSSITGSDFVLLVTEPTVSGLHDLKRVYEVVKHFKIDAGVCINKSDLNHDYSKLIKKFCEENGIPLIGEIPYSKEIPDAISEGKVIIEYIDHGKVYDAIKKIGDSLFKMVEQQKN